MNPIFWQPTNTIGTAATIDTVFDDQPIKLNFYWSGVELAVVPKTQEQLTAQINEFLEVHPLVDRRGQNVFHLLRRGNDFVQIETSDWVSPVRT
ncbi:MAG TPA: hypothetical protein VFI84_01225 [Candidatus Saccharimonadales bacterium]|nr:hypothetical protein [Candidatus Saccharimonadales bacterium]